MNTLVWFAVDPLFDFFVLGRSDGYPPEMTCAYHLSFNQIRPRFVFLEQWELGESQAWRPFEPDLRRGLSAVPFGSVFSIRLVSKDLAAVLFGSLFSADLFSCSGKAQE